MKLRMYLRGLGLGLIVAALILSFGIKTENKTMSDAEIRAKARELGMVDDSTTLKAPDEKTEEQESPQPSEGKVKEEVAAEVKEEPQEITEVAEEGAQEVSESAEEQSQELDQEEETEEAEKTDEEIKAEEEAQKKAEEEAKKKAEEEAKKKAAEEEEAKKKAEEEAKKKAEEEAKKKAEEEAKKKAEEEAKKKAEEEAKKKAEEEAKKKAEEEAKKKAEEETKKKESGKAYTLTIERGYSSDRVARILEDAGVVDNAASFDKYLCSNGYDHKISTGSYFIPAKADYSTIAKLITHSK